jgi:S1-C subfamily serine protease
MHDEDTGSAQQGGWQPPEYVSPWLPASGSPQGGEGANDTISYRGGPAYDGSQQPTDGQGYQPAPGYGPGPAAPGYGGPGGDPGYGPPGYGQNPWGGYGAPPPPPPRSGFSRTLAYLAVAVLAAGAGAGVAVALNNNTSTPAALAPSSGNAGIGGAGGGTGTGGGTGIGGGGTQTNPFAGGGFGGFGSTGNGDSGGTGTGTGTGTGGTNAGTGSLNATSLSAKVDPGLVDVTSDLKWSGATAEGTGMVISSNGLVLTNNHVIDQSTSVSAQLVVSGKTYTAEVIGYNSTDDVALLQLVGASGLKTVSLSDSTKVKVGEAVLALGNAGGRGGLPSTAQGTIAALNQSIKASDEGAGTTESLHGMLETDAPIQEGDSGGPLVNGSGQVVGMDTAAQTADNGQQTTATQGYAIPINQAIAIADQIDARKASTSVHIGLAGFIGVSETADCGTVTTGALVCEVVQGTPASTAGLVSGDVITSVNGQKITSFSGLTDIMEGTHPGTKLSVVYVDSSGARHTTTVTLTGWAK